MVIAQLRLRGWWHSLFSELHLQFADQTYAYFRPIAKGVGAVGRPSPVLKGHLSADCWSADILNIVRLWNRINKIEWTYNVGLSFDHNVTSSVIIILNIEISPRQPLGTPIFKSWKGPKSEKNVPLLWDGWLRACTALLLLSANRWNKSD